MPLNNFKEFSREAKEAVQAAVKNAWVALKEEHEIMNIIFKNQAQFPRSERVLIVSAALLGQLWVTGLFQSSGLLQAQWACAATSSGELQLGALNDTDWCNSNCIVAGNSTSTKKQDCQEFCVCDKIDPELVYMVAHAIFVVLITGVPLSILVFMFTTGYEKLIEADELRIMVMLRQLDIAMDHFEMRKDWFVVVVADAIPAPAHSFEQLTKCIRATMTVLEEGNVKEGYTLSKQGRYNWVVFLRDSLRFMDKTLETGRRDQVVSSVEHILQLESIHPGIALAMQDDSNGKTKEVNQSVDIQRANWFSSSREKYTDKTKEDTQKVGEMTMAGSSLVGLGYCIVTSYILFTSWSILTFALQYGPTDARMWLHSFTASFLADLFLMNPLSIVFNAFVYAPVMTYYVKPKVKELISQRKEKQGKRAVRVVPVISRSNRV